MCTTNRGGRPPDARTPRRSTREMSAERRNRRSTPRRRTTRPGATEAVCVAAIASESTVPAGAVTDAERATGVDLRREWSGGELLATLGTAGREDGTPRTGAHTQAKAVRLRAPTVVGLERALTHLVLLKAAVRTSAELARPGPHPSLDGGRRLRQPGAETCGRKPTQSGSSAGCMEAAATVVAATEQRYGADSTGSNGQGQTSEVQRAMPRATHGRRTGPVYIDAAGVRSCGHLVVRVGGERLTSRRSAPVRDTASAACR